MADTYEKRARERRKQQRRREKLSRKHNADPDAPRSEETDGSEYLMTPEDRENEEETTEE